MITSLMFNRVVNIGVNSKREIFLNINGKDTKLNLDSDIPVIRYRFANTITNNEIDFIKKNMQTFNRTVHIVEFNYNEVDVNIIQQIRNAQLMVGIILHVDINEEEVLNKQLNAEHIALTTIGGLGIDRVVFNDKSDKMDTIAFNALCKAFASAHGINKNDIGICGSPLSFGENCCLSAVKAREIMARYSTIKDLPLPSSNHQDMNNCGCIRFVIVTDDIALREIVKSTNKTQTNKTEKVKEVKKKSPTGVNLYNQFSL